MQRLKTLIIILAAGIISTSGPLLASDGDVHIDPITNTPITVDPITNTPITVDPITNTPITVDPITVDPE